MSGAEVKAMNFTATLIGVFIAIIICIFAYQAYVRVTCKNGHLRQTGRTHCWGTSSSMTCGPETEFICND